jgi:hypothetical protein
MTISKTLSALVAACAVTAGLSACTLPAGDTVAVPAPGGRDTATTQCQSAGLAAAIPSHEAAEPQLRIPQPPGWERTTMIDSQFVRYTLVNRELIHDGFAPTVVVGLDTVPGQHAPDVLFEANRYKLIHEGQVTDLNYTGGTVCGNPAETVTYTGSPNGQAARPLTDLAIVIDGGDRTYFVNVVIQSRDDTNPTYQRDKQTILSGFQAVPSGPAAQSV